ncbi:MAG: ribonuclease D [Thiotrichales bacterium]
MTSINTAETQFINQPDTLKAFCERALKHNWVAIDTEFLREKTYYSQLCLVQIATLDEIACIDPLALNDLAPLEQLLTSPDLLKVMHSGGQDMETLIHTLGSVPTPVFDTQIAAALLGEGEQISYAALVKSLLNIELPKSQTRTNWAKRPLSESQLQYAADDVRYLCDVYLRETDALRALDRLDWALEESARLEKSGDLETQGIGLLRKVKGQHLMPVMARAIIRECALWREQIAQKRDLPRKWILPDKVLLELGETPVTETRDLKRIPSLTSKQISHYGEQLIACIKKVYEQDEAHWLNVLRPNKVTPEQQSEIKKLQKIVEKAARENNISQSLIASRKDLERYVLDGEDILLFSGWRKILVGSLEID